MNPTTFPAVYQPHIIEQKRLLVIDDASDMHLMLATQLGLAGYRLTMARSGQDALDSIQRDGLPDLVLLDIMMPGMDGFEVAAAIHQLGPIPIICLSALSDVETKVDALNRFADDYVTKPFAFSELLARIERVLRRVSCGLGNDADVTIDERLHINFAQQYALVDAEQIPLTPIECRIMQTLYQNRGRVLPAEFLLQRSWDSGRQGTIQSLWVHIRRLRSKIEADPDHPQYVVTVRGQGYCMQI